MALWQVRSSERKVIRHPGTVPTSSVTKPSVPTEMLPTQTINLQHTVKSQD